MNDSIEHRTGEELTFIPIGLKVSVFGRERVNPDKSSKILYYWVYDGKNRFKALPEQLRKTSNN